MSWIDNITPESQFQDRLTTRIRILVGELGPSKRYNSDPGHRLNELLTVVQLLERHHCTAMIPLLSGILNEDRPINQRARTQIERTIHFLINKVGGFCNTCHRALADRTTEVDNDCAECGQPVGPRPLHCVDG